MPQDDCARTAFGLSPFKLLGIGLSVALALPLAQAQVHRCSDANGNITYTDGQCPSGNAAVQIEAAKTPEQLALEQQRAEEARIRLTQQRLEQLEERRINAETAALEASARASAATEAAARIQSYNYADSAACKEATRQLNRSQSPNGRYSSEDQQRLLRAQDAADKACLSPQDYAAVVRERASRPTTTIVINPPYGAPPHLQPPWSPPGYQPPQGYPPIMLPPIHTLPPITKPLPNPGIPPAVLRPHQPAAQSGVLSPPRSNPDLLQP